jgi:hypothetical protein
MNKKQQISAQFTHAETVVSPQDLIDPTLNHNSYKGLLHFKFIFRPVETVEHEVTMIACMLFTKMELLKETVSDAVFVSQVTAINVRFRTVSGKIRMT